MIGMTLDELAQRLHGAPHGELRRIERETGVNYATIRALRDGRETNPTLSTFNSLVEWCKAHPLRPTSEAA